MEFGPICVRSTLLHVAVLRFALLLWLCICKSHRSKYCRVALAGHKRGGKRVFWSWDGSLCAPPLLRALPRQRKHIFCDKVCVRAASEAWLPTAAVFPRRVASPPGMSPRTLCLPPASDPLFVLCMMKHTLVREGNEKLNVDL